MWYEESAMPDPTWSGRKTLGCSEGLISCTIIACAPCKAKTNATGDASLVSSPLCGPASEAWRLSALELPIMPKSGSLQVAVPRQRKTRRVGGLCWRIPSGRCAKRERPGSGTHPGAGLFYFRPPLPPDGMQCSARDRPCFLLMPRSLSRQRQNRIRPLGRMGRDRQ